jgi:rare lipoprotein A
MKISFFTIIFSFLCCLASAQDKSLTGGEPASDSVVKGVKVYFGTASYYAEKFNGRKTASGEAYDSDKFTAACNVLPLGTWIRVTNLRNKRSVIVKTNDRLHVKMKRVVDLSYAAAEKLGYTERGLTQVKVEVLGKKPG